MVEIAKEHGIKFSICSQRTYLVAGASDARCVDATRLEEISGKRFMVALRGNRKECGCFESRDIGEYDTCPHGCVYCYAVQTPELAQRRFRRHDPQSEFLFEPESSIAESGDQSIQLPLFPG
jgi:hypothetical protein